MSTRWFAVLFGVCLCLVSAPVQGETPGLLARSNIGDLRLDLSDGDRRWLRKRRTLWLGVSRPDRVPFDITGTGRDYEGVTADYAGMLGTLLGVEIRVRRYDSRSAAIRALHAAEIDLLGTVNAEEAARNGLLLSQPYVESPPVLVRHADTSSDVDPRRPGVRLAMRNGYLPEAYVRQQFPEARLLVFPSRLNALGAVSFGQADVFIGDMLSASYLIHKNYLTHLKVSPTDLFDGGDYGFAMTPANLPLKVLSNRALARIPAQTRQNILRRWQGGAGGYGAVPSLDLSEEEQDWLRRNPRLKVASDGWFPPVSYQDEHGVFRGISADLLEQISQRTGLVFEQTTGGSFDELVEALEQRRVDIVASLPFSLGRQERLGFSRSYLSSGLVLVTRDGDRYLNSLDALAGKRVAMVQGSVIEPYLREQHPQVQMVFSSGPQQALERLATGEAEAAVISLVGARYLVARYWREQLSIRSALPVPPAHFAFATRSDARLLQSILNKALLSLAPQDLDELTNRWHGEVIVADSYWQKYRGLIIQSAIVAVVMLLVAMFWIRSLRREIHKRQVAESALNDQLEFMRVMIDGTPNPIYVRGRDGTLHTCNASYLQALGVERDAVIGQSVPEWLIGTAQARSWREAYREVMAQGVSVVADRELVLDGRRLTINHWMLPFRGSDGAVTGLIGGWVDVSERQQLCNALQLAKDDADAANQAKTTFLATMSHEIRTPTNALLGMLELAVRKAEQGQLDRLAIEVASNAARGLLGLVGDILDITRIESGHLELAPQQVDLCREVRSTVGLFDGEARKKRLRLSLDMDSSGPVQVLLDPVRFKQVLSNLISNAIKFTHDGEVCVGLTLDVQPQRVGMLLTVEDTGVGIPADELEGLGRPFCQASNNDQSARSGCGLGLNISYTLCAMMGGEMRLDSTLGVGTRAHIRLDLPRLVQAGAEQAGLPQLPEGCGAPLDILVVDDYPMNRLLLQQQLAYLGHRVTTANNGREALRSWLRQRFDVLITDCNMPGLDGYALARAVREDERRKHKASALLLGCTADARREERQRCLDAGMDDCLFKPLNLSALAARLAPGARRADEQGQDQASAVQGLDLSGLRALTGGDLASVKSLLGDLLGSNREDLQQLTTLHQANDLRGLADLAHRVKGGARIIKARSLLLACEALEQACQQSLPAQRLDPLVNDLYQVMAALTRRLEDYCRP